MGARVPPNEDLNSGVLESDDLHNEVKGTLDELARRVHSDWMQRPDLVEAGATDAGLAAFEARHGVRLPPAFVALWRRADGNHGDSNLTRFWPLAEIGPLPEVHGFKHGIAYPAEMRERFAFADYMIFSHVYAVRLTAAGEDGPVWWVYDAEQIEIAPTFESFLRAYASDPNSILFPRDYGQSDGMNGRGDR